MKRSNDLLNHGVQAAPRCLALLFFSFGVLTLAWATQPYTPRVVNPLTESWRWKHFPELEGKGIRQICQAPDEKVWVSFDQGVMEYDGYDWRVHNASNGLATAPVEHLLIKSDGVILATTTAGIYAYDGQQWTHFFVAPDNRTLNFLSLKELQDHSVVACTNWGMLHFRNNHTIDLYSSEVKSEQLKSDVTGVNWIMLPSEVLTEAGDFNYASDILEDESGQLWLALTLQTELGSLLRFRLEEVRDKQVANYQVYNRESGLELGEGQQLIQAMDGRIWITNTTSDKGILIYDEGSWETVSLNTLFGGDEYVSSIVQSKNGSIWLGSIAEIITYHQGQWEIYRAPTYPVPANRIVLKNSVRDQLWIFGYKSKALLLDFSFDQWLTYENLSFQFEVSPEEQWFLERNNRIVIRRGKTWVSTGREDGLMDAPIRIIRTNQGQVWAAGSHQGVAATARWENGRWERHLHPQLSWGIDYRAIFEADDGALWFGAAVDADRKYGFQSGTLELVDPLADKLSWVHHPSGVNGLDQSNVYGIGQSSDGRIWIGGSNLLYYDGISWNNLPDERLQQYVNCVYSTDRLLFVGSRYYGLFVYDGKEWINYTTDDGLSGNTIISIDALSDTAFIVATENDICKFDGTSWTKNIFPEHLNIDFEGGTIHHTDNYIWINHVPRSWKRRAFQNDEHQDQIGFFTTRYQPSQTPPETYIDFYADEIAADGNSLISWNGKDYFSKTAPTQLMFSYRMDEGAWSPFSLARQHTFTSLSSGQHHLEVRSRDLDFNIDPTPVAINFEVLPPIWKRAWFIALILTFLMIYGFYEYRVVTKKQKLELLNQSLQEANTALKYRGQQITQQNDEILSQQQQILQQSQILEQNNQDLAERNIEIEKQRDQLEIMVEQVEGLSKAKLSFFTNISHELRTPLTLILGPISQLQKSNLSTRERQQLYHIIDRNASRLLKLINQLLEMRRIEQHTLELHWTNIKLDVYLKDIMELFCELAKQREVKLNFICKQDIQLGALDQDKVEKIVVNLLSNAFRHTPEGGKISLELNRVKGAHHQLDSLYPDYFAISVADTGYGISQEHINVIFEKYFTTTSEFTRVAGAGIGLPYIKELVSLMQGDITVESTPGEGTRFTVFLPIHPAIPNEEDKPNENISFQVARREVSVLLTNYLEEEAPDAAVDNGMVSKPPGILIVDDNPDMLHFLENLLKLHYRVVTAKDGKEALQIANDKTLDLIISDVMMPVMDGFTLCQRIKEDFATSHIPVILLTAKARAESELSGLQRGADDYITKPFNPELLLARVANLLQQRDSLREVFNKEFMLTPKEELVASPDEEFLEKLVALMNDKLEDATFNVEAMCKAMHLSHMHFIRKVKQLTGKKPIELLRSFRMKRAKQLLSQQKLTIAEVAYRVGFDLPNSFSRAFKKEFQQTPTEYINSLEKLPQ